MAARLTTLVESSRPALGRLEVKPEPVDLVTLLRETVAALDPDAAGRVQTTLQEGIKGLERGLYLWRGIAEAHGGAIWAVSHGPGQGAAFHVRRPCNFPLPRFA